MDARARVQSSPSVNWRGRKGVSRASAPPPPMLFSLRGPLTTWPLGTERNGEVNDPGAVLGGPGGEAGDGGERATGSLSGGGSCHKSLCTCGICDAAGSVWQSANEKAPLWRGLIVMAPQLPRQSRRGGELARGPRVGPTESGGPSESCAMRTALSARHRGTAGHEASGLARARIPAMFIAFGDCWMADRRRRLRPSGTIGDLTASAKGAPAANR